MRTTLAVGFSGAAGFPICGRRVGTGALGVVLGGQPGGASFGAFRVPSNGVAIVNTRVTSKSAPTAEPTPRKARQREAA